MFIEKEYENRTFFFDKKKIYKMIAHCIKVKRCWECKIAPLILVKPSLKQDLKIYLHRNSKS